MKNKKRGDAMGRRSLRSSLLAHPDTKFFSGKRGIGTKPEKTTAREPGVEVFSFCFSSLAERGCSGPQRSRGAPFLWRGASVPLDGEDRCETIS